MTMYKKKTKKSYHNFTRTTIITITILIIRTISNNKDNNYKLHRIVDDCTALLTLEQAAELKFNNKCTGMLNVKIPLFFVFLISFPSDCLH